jgi:predicted  nucleic acid-binding Zn-ribbon protein
MNPQIAALYDLQHRDRLLNQLEHKLDSIPARVKELDGDLGKLEAMLEAERKKCEETRQFQRAQQAQLSDEEELVRQSKAKISQVKTARELSATQRELESTRRMITTRSDEINKLQQGVEETEQRIAAMQGSLEELRTSATAEKARLAELKEKLEGRITKLRQTRVKLTQKLDAEVLGTYERIRRRLGGLAFVAAHRERCMACKMVVPHQIYVLLRKGDDIPACESCGRMLYWSGHFPDDKPDEPAPKSSPPKVRPGADD